MFLVGDRTCGKVDHVPGLFYVTTRFLHVWYVPIVPRESYLIFDEPSAPGTLEGMPMRIQWKSVIVAWMRGMIVFLIVILVLPTPALPFEKGWPPEGWKILALMIGSAAVLGGCYYATMRLTRASLGRAIELGRMAGLSEAIVERRFFGDRPTSRVAADDRIRPL